MDSILTLSKVSKRFGAIVIANDVDLAVAKGEALTGIKRKLFFWALDLGLRYEVHGRSWWYNMQLALARKLIFSKWQAALGGNVRICASGSGGSIRVMISRWKVGGRWAKSSFSVSCTGSAVITW